LEKSRFPYLELTGAPRERGRQYGAACRPRIQSSITNYGGMFEAFSGISWKKARKTAAGFIGPIQDYCPKVLEEMEGISEGAGIDFEDILTLNARSEIVLASQTDGCTSFGLAPRVSGNGKTYVCQNWDWIRSQEDSLVVIRLEQEDEPTILMIAEAGMVGGKGINSAGLGLALNALTTGRGKIGVPVHVLLRGILDSRTLSDAVQAVAVPERASSGNFLVGSSEGEIIDIESAPEDYWVFYGERGWLTHTNHFFAPNLVSRLEDRGKTMLPDTFQRLGRINVLIGEREGQVGFDCCREFLADHRNRPDSICRHEDPRDPEGKQMASVYGMILDLTEGTVWFSGSNPCESDFRPFRLNS